MRLWCATSNPGKLAEFRLAGPEIEPLPGLRDIPPSPEDFATFEENAVQKALYYSGFGSGLVFADDSGLVVDALKGEPGVRSARFAGEQATAAQNRELLLRRLDGFEDRRARFVCVIALAREGSLLGCFRGEVEGEIFFEPRGSGGFGYDSLFFYPPLERGFAELDEEEKIHVSHRGRALRALLAFAENLE